MKIKKYSEKYEFTYDGDIATEYAKFIISKFLDEEEEKTLEDIFYEIAKSDDLIDEGNDDRASFVKDEILLITKQLYDMAKKIRTVDEIAASKYNL